MQFIYQYPDTHGTEVDMLDAGPVDQVAKAVEAAGFGGFAFTEHPAPGARWLSAGGHQTLDPFVALGFAAAATERIRLLTYLCVLPYRNPMLTAKAAATVDKLSGGRFILGVGTGYLKGEFSALGVDLEERNILFDEALDVLPLHWSGEPFSYTGRHFSAKEAIGRPRPVQQPIPIWIGGNSRLTRRRVAERAQGWMPLVLPPAMIPTVRTSALGDMTEVATWIAEMREAAGGRTLDVTFPYMDDDLRADPGKDVNRHREAFAQLADIGVTWVMVPGATETESDTMAFLDSFGSHYLQET
ncbi:MAG: LLM class F420-dependent oxidoreductase [Acidobacteriota bacterium]|nr:LLM class F420-dependent oxidoreductase [Acidobacteriota bacterium]